MQTELGYSIHNFLVKRSEERLKKEGYQVLKNVPVAPNIRIDLMGTKGSEKVGVECLVKPSEKSLEKRKKLLCKHLTKLIFAVPSYTNFKPKDAWEFEIKIEGG